jgi:raffinose/stachyose/melibiose transport system substrate-binding protein
MRRLSTLPRALAILAVATAVAATSVGPASAGPTKTSSMTGVILTPAQVRAMGKVTLTEYDFETSGGLSPTLIALESQFEKTFPNVTIKRETRDFNDYGKTVALLMSSSDAPDLAEANVPMARILIPAHLVISLTPYYDGYGWSKVYPSAVLGLLKSANGKTFGTGPYWGEAFGGNMVGVYYDKRVLSSLGLTVPTTFAQFQGDLATAKAKGVLPVQLGNLDQYPANHVLSTLINAFTPAHTVRNWLNGVPGSTFDVPGIVQAAGVLREWFKDGYIPAQVNGTTYNDAVASFNKGQGLFYITGSWEEPIFHQGLGNNVGFFVLPPQSAGGVSYPTGWLTNPFTISSKSKNAALAAFFLAYTVSHSLAEAAAGGYLPFQKPTPTTDETYSDVVRAWETALSQNSLVPYLDFATPGMDTTLYPAIQSMMTGQISPQSFVKTVQGAWTAYYG